MSNFLNNTKDLQKILDTLNGGSFVDTSDATASAGEILSGETAYVNGVKVTGSLVVHDYYTGTSEPSSSLGSDGDLYFMTGG